MKPRNKFMWTLFVKEIHGTGAASFVCKAPYAGRSLCSRPFFDVDSSSEPISSRYVFRDVSSASNILVEVYNGGGASRVVGHFVVDPESFSSKNPAAAPPWATYYYYGCPSLAPTLLSMSSSAA